MGMGKRSLGNLGDGHAWDTAGDAARCLRSIGSRAQVSRALALAALGMPLSRRCCGEAHDDHQSLSLSTR